MKDNYPDVWCPVIKGFTEETAEGAVYAAAKKMEDDLYSTLYSLDTLFCYKQPIRGNLIPEKINSLISEGYEDVGVDVCIWKGDWVLLGDEYLLELIDELHHATVEEYIVMGQTPPLVSIYRERKTDERY